MCEDMHKRVWVHKCVCVDVYVHVGEYVRLGENIHYRFLEKRLLCVFETRKTLTRAAHARNVFDVVCKRYENRNGKGSK